MTFRVEDNGPGIPPDQREDALKPFARLDPARNQNKGSSVGLGLPIANDIARAHGGHLILSEAQRRWSARRHADCEIILKPCRYAVHF